MYTGMELGALTFKSIFEKAQSLVSKVKSATKTADKYLPSQVPTQAPVALPVEVSPVQAVEAPMSEASGVNWWLIGGAAAAGLLILKLFRRKK